MGGKGNLLELGSESLNRDAVGAILTSPTGRKERVNGNYSVIHSLSPPSDFSLRPLNGMTYCPGMQTFVSAMLTKREQSS